MAPHPLMHRCKKRRKRAAVRALFAHDPFEKPASTFSDHAHFAGTRERAGARRGTSPRPHAAPTRRSTTRIAPGIRFAPEMIARAIMPHISFTDARGRNDRISDRARIGGPRRDCAVGGVPVSAEIIPFMPRPKRNRPRTDFPRLAFRPTAGPADLAMDHADTSPCEYPPGANAIDPGRTRADD